MSKQRHRSRRPVEIYFVLYLAALIFLIPNPGEKGQSRKEDQQSSIELPFSIRPEKSVLFCRMIIDSSSAKIIHIDSMNTVFHTGEVEDLEYEFIVEDQVYNQRIKLVADIEQNNRFFSIKENRDDQSASFKWMPPLDDKLNKSYIVYVNASGKPKGDGREVTARTQFTLVINFYDKETGLPMVPEELPTIVDNNQLNLSGENRPNLSDFTLSLRNDLVQTTAYQEWENHVFILGGLNPLTDLLKNPDITIKHNPENNGGSVSIANYFSNGIVLKGKSPAFGSMNVQISLKRRYDNQEASIGFKVDVQGIGNPDFASEMYPGITYQIKPNLPFIDGQEIKAILKEGDKIRAQSATGETFSISPQMSDTGKTFLLERYVNGNLIGQKFRIYVKNFPPPMIVKLTKIGDKSVRLQTNSYGLFNNRENTVLKLEFSGNATLKQELFGQYKPDRKSNTWTQYFEVVPKDINKPFVFKVNAVDRRGVRSEQEGFDE